MTKKRRRGKKGKKTKPKSQRKREEKPGYQKLRGGSDPYDGLGWSQERGNSG